MSDWLKRISHAISGSQKDESKLVDFEDSLNENVALLNTKEIKKPNTFFTQVRLQRADPSFANRAAQLPPLSPQNSENNKNSYTQEERHPSENATSHEASMREIDEKLAALQRLRSLPRGSQVESRIAAITDLLGEVEIFNTLKLLRWPQGVICPRCKSTNVVRRDPPVDASDQRHFYICLNCKGEGNPSDFDDFTGLPINSLFALRQCILCWYLIGFCSINQIAKVLGLSISEVIKLASLGSEFAEGPAEDKALQLSHDKENKDRQVREKKRVAEIEGFEDVTRSESKSPHKPSYKSKK